MTRRVAVPSSRAGTIHERPAGPAGRVSMSKVEWLEEHLSDRDWAIIHVVNRLRLVTGKQLQILFFNALGSPRSQTVSRSRVLRRLVAWRVLVPLARRVGGAGRGSSVQAFALNSAGQRLVAHQQRRDAQPVRVRRPGTPGERTVKHTLAISQLYVDLVVRSRVQGLALDEFATEPACWWPNGLGGFIKPDAYVRLHQSHVVDHWWIEHDEATESLPTIRTKLLAYLDFVQRGQLGPYVVQPRVLVSTVSEPRRRAIEALMTRLPPPADQLFAVVQAHEAADFLQKTLAE